MIRAMELHIVLEGRKDLSAQLARQLRAAIRAGRLAAGDQLPPSRLLAEQLQLGRKTVAEAYARLALDGMLVSRVGRGTFVAGTPAAPPYVAPPLAAPAASGQVARWNALPTPLRHVQPEGVSRYEFIGGYASKGPYPHEEWRRCVLAGLRDEAASHGRYVDAEGVPALRQAIAQFAGFTRGVRCQAGDILVTNGAQQALDLLARVLVAPGDVVTVEEPGYPPARLLFESQGARVVLVPVDPEGLVVDAIPPATRLVYVTPSHQFPLGMPLSAARRQALLERARALGAFVIEDDYDSAFRYAGLPQDSLQRLDGGACVVYVGTFSKVLTPSLRIGYLVAPPMLLAALATAKHLGDWHNATLNQHALAHFIGNGGLARHIRRCHAAYAARRERLLARIDGDLAPWLEAIPTTVGFHLSAWLRRPLDVDLLCRLARRIEVGIYPLAAFYAGTPQRQGLFFGFGAIDSIDIDAALDRLLRVLREIDAQA
jgi:GntR family transcriptional regulator/MocR family aminotransferase